MAKPHPWALAAVSLFVGLALGRSLGALTKARGFPPTSASMGRKAPGWQGTLDFAVPVMMYHRITELPDDADESLRNLTVTPKNFALQMEYLVENGYAVLTATEVHTAVRLGEPLPEKAVTITLDDGYDSQFNQAFPILQRYGLDATLFLVSGTLGSARHATWAEAQQMSRAGLDVGSHSVGHLNLVLLSRRHLDNELRNSKRALERALGVGIVQFAYPYGQYDDRVKQRARRAGYLAGWRAGGGWVTAASDPFMLPRVRVGTSTTMARFIQMITQRPAPEEAAAPSDPRVGDTQTPSATRSSQ